ncbi:methyltransferase [Elizabethkingia anophelis]|nr:methyltransferase [Elizabethkingia anophelis]
MQITDKIILDACCGSRMFWFDKENPDVLFQDIRKEEHILCDGRTLKVNPDIQADFRDMPYQDGAFKLVVFDPPHMKTLGKNSWMAKKYGVLSSTWQDDLQAGFNECMRVLQVDGVLIFKWNESDIKLSEVIKLFSIKPLLGHTSGRHGKTIWLTFMKK